MSTVMKLKTTVIVENFPEYARNLPYIVARLDEVTNKFWFYGAWEEESEANRVAEELGDDAFVFDNDKVLEGVE